jgi:hypothetical protein
MPDVVIKAIVPLVNALAGRDVVNAPGDISFPIRGSPIYWGDLLVRGIPFRLTPPVAAPPVPSDPPPVPRLPPPVPSEPPPVPNELPVPMPVVVDCVPADPLIDEPPMEPAEEPPAAALPPAPAAKAQLPDAAKPAANISVVIFMDILLRLWTRDKTRRGGTFRRSGKRAPSGPLGGEISSMETGQRER